MGVEPFLLSARCWACWPSAWCAKPASCHGRCEACGHTGYAAAPAVRAAGGGRRHARADPQPGAEADIRAAALAGGMQLMREDGERLVARASPAAKKCCA
jgi:general secretion pathway protein E